MYKNKRILAVILARGGSKSIPGKNIRMLAKKPLIAWTIEEAQESKYIDKLILSSDSKKIIDVSKRYGCEAPFVRPDKLSGDKSSSVDALIHAVKTITEKYDYVVLLQCTSPLRKVKDIDAAIAFCIDHKSSSCISVCEAKKSPYLMRKIDKRGRLHPILNSIKSFLPRQSFPKVYMINGAFYMIKTAKLLKIRNLIAVDTVAYIMDEKNSLDIDTIGDFKLAENLLKKGKTK